MYKYQFCIFEYLFLLVATVFTIVVMVTSKKSKPHIVDIVLNQQMEFYYDRKIYHGTYSVCKSCGCVYRVSFYNCLIYRTVVIVNCKRHNRINGVRYQCHQQ